MASVGESSFLECSTKMPSNLASSFALARSMTKPFSPMVAQQTEIAAVADARLVAFISLPFREAPKQDQVMSAIDRTAMFIPSADAKAEIAC